MNNKPPYRSVIRKYFREFVVEGISNSTTHTSWYNNATSPCTFNHARNLQPNVISFAIRVSYYTHSRDPYY